MTPKNFSESYMIHRIIIFLSLSFSMLGMVLYIIGTHDTSEIPVLIMVRPSNITNTSNKYRAAKKDDLTSFVEARLQL